MTISTFLNMLPTWEASGVCTEHTVLIISVRCGRYDTVGGKDDRTIESGKFLFLFPPGITVITHQMLVLLETWIIMCRKHFSVGIHINTRSFCLFQQVFYILQVMTGYQDTGILTHTDIHFRNLGITISLCIGLVEQCHHIHTILACLQYKTYQTLHISSRIGYHGECLHHEVDNLFIMFIQTISMLIIGSHALESEYSEFLE